MTSEINPCEIDPSEINLHEDIVTVSLYGECPVCFLHIHNEVLCDNDHVMCARCYLTLRDQSIMAFDAGAATVSYPKCPLCRIYITKQFRN